MARAYICTARNDLSANKLQVLDLAPHTSLRLQTYDPAGQTCYIGLLPQNATVATEAAGADLVTSAVYLGLAAYLLDNVANINGNAITAANANAIAHALLVRVAAGSSLTEAAVNAVIGATVAASGVGLGSSRATVEDLLKILAGHVYKLPANCIVSVGVGTDFPVAASGFFATRPQVQRNPIHGRLSGQPVQTSLPAQQAPKDGSFRAVPDVIHTPELVASATTGALSKLAASTYAFFDPCFTYGRGTAQDVAGAAIGSNHEARAVVVYAADGTVLS